MYILCIHLVFLLGSFCTKVWGFYFVPTVTQKHASCFTHFASFFLWAGALYVAFEAVFEHIRGQGIFCFSTCSEHPESLVANVCPLSWVGAFYCIYSPHVRICICVWFNDRSSELQRIIFFNFHVHQGTSLMLYPHRVFTWTNNIGKYINYYLLINKYIIWTYHWRFSGFWSHEIIVPVSFPLQWNYTSNCPPESIAELFLNQSCHRPTPVGPERPWIRR